MSWYQALGVCTAAKLYRATHRVTAEPLLSHAGLANSLPSEVLFISLLHMSGYSIWLLWGLPDPGIQLSSQWLPFSTVMHCRLVLYTHSQRENLLKFLRNNYPLISSTYIRLKSNPDHPVWNHPWMFCLYLRRINPIRVYHHETHLFSCLLETVYLFYVPNATPAQISESRHINCHKEKSFWH